MRGTPGGTPKGVLRVTDSSPRPSEYLQACHPTRLPRWPPASILRALGFELACVRLTVPFELALPLESVAHDLAFVLDGELGAIRLAIHREGHFAVLVFRILNLGLRVQNRHRARQLVAIQLELDRHIDRLTVDLGCVFPGTVRIGFAVRPYHAGDRQQANHCRDPFHCSTSLDEKD